MATPRLSGAIAARQQQVIQLSARANGFTDEQLRAAIASEFMIVAGDDDAGRWLWLSVLCATRANRLEAGG